MNRRQLLSLVTGGFIASLLSACENNFPSTPTVVTGKVVDENGMPLEGVNIHLYGTKLKGISPIPTFDVETLSDKDGTYYLSYVVPGRTHRVEVFPQLNKLVNFKKKRSKQPI